MEEIEKLLRKHHIRPTAMRVLMYKFLKSRNAAVALTDIEVSFDKSDRTTIYRTIKTFEKNALVHQIDDGTGIAKYALHQEESSRDLHLHFHCIKCNETICLTDHTIPHISLPEGFVTRDMNLVVKGTCDKCSPD